MEGVIVVTLIAGTIILAHLLYVIVGRVRAAKQNRKDKPSIGALVATITIVLFLWAMAIPNFLKFCAKSKQSEAKTNLGAIYVAQLSYFSNTNTYAGGPNAFQFINWEPAGQNRYAYYCQGAMIANKLPMGIDYVSKPEGRWPVSLKPQSSKTGFTCMAVGNIDNDPFLDVWSINDAKMLVNDQDDV